MAAVSPAQPVPTMMTFSTEEDMDIAGLELSLKVARLGRGKFTLFREAAERLHVVDPRDVVRIGSLQVVPVPALDRQVYRLRRFHGPHRFADLLKRGRELRPFVAGVLGDLRLDLGLLEDREKVPFLPAGDRKRRLVD